MFAACLSHFSVASIHRHALVEVIYARQHVVRMVRKRRPIGILHDECPARPIGRETKPLILKRKGSTCSAFRSIDT